MNSCELLTQYLNLMARRLRRYCWITAATLVIVCALLLTLGEAWILTAVAPSPVVFFTGRLFLFAGVAIAATLAAMPLLRINPKAVARRLERRFPDFDARLITFVDRRFNQPPDPFLPLLAGDALEVSRATSPEIFIRGRTFVSTAIPGVVGGIVLGWLILSGFGAIGYGARALWTGKNAFSIEISANRKTVRRGSGVAVTAHLNGFSVGSVALWVRMSGAKEWTRLSMVAVESRGSEFLGRLDRLQQSATYYAEADGVRSEPEHVNVVDLPGVKSMAVTYPSTQDGEETDGDVIAPAGAVANIEIETDRPMSAGELVLDEGDPINLPSGGGNRTSAKLRVLRDGAYHVSVIYAGELVQVSDEHSIEVLSRDKSQPRPAGLLDGVHSGPVPAGYEKAVSDYYKRLSDLQASR